MNRLFREVIIPVKLGGNSLKGRLHAENIVRLGAFLSDITSSAIRIFFLGQNNQPVILEKLRFADKVERTETKKLIQLASEICRSAIWVGNNFNEIARRGRFGISRPELIVAPFDFGASLLPGTQTDPTDFSYNLFRLAGRPFATQGPDVNITQLKTGSENRNRRILVPTNLKRSSRAAEIYALSIAKKSRAHVTLFHCTWPIVRAAEASGGYFGVAVPSTDEISKSAMLDANRELAKRRQFFLHHGVKCDVVVDDRPSRLSYLISAKARENYSLIVMGNRSRHATPFKNSDVSQVIFFSAIPVVVA